MLNTNLKKFQKEYIGTYITDSVLLLYYLLSQQSLKLYSQVIPLAAICISHKVGCGDMTTLQVISIGHSYVRMCIYPKIKIASQSFLKTG